MLSAGSGSLSVSFLGHDVIIRFLVKSAQKLILRFARGYCRSVLSGRWPGKYPRHLCRVFQLYELSDPDALETAEKEAGINGSGG